MFVPVLLKISKVIVMANFVYMVRCKDNSIYTGWTTDLKRRIEQHNNEEGAKYTRGRTPVKLEYYEKCETRSKALKREHEIKGLKKAEKERLIKEFHGF